MHSKRTNKHGILPCFFFVRLCVCCSCTHCSNGIAADAFGICEPVAICRMERWELEYKYIDGRRLVFDGRVGSFLGQWIKWGLLSFITLGIYSWWVPIKKQKWITEHTHFESRFV